MYTNTTKHNNSKKISELRPLEGITKHQENSWIPIAQYNSRTDTYVNITLNVKSLTDYSSYAAYEIAEASAYQLAYDFSYKYDPQEWLKLAYVGKQDAMTTYVGYAISNSPVASNLFSYTFAYTVSTLGWQYFDGTEEHAGG